GRAPAPNRRSAARRMRRSRPGMQASTSTQDARSLTRLALAIRVGMRAIPGAISPGRSPASRCSLERDCGATVRYGEVGAGHVRLFRKFFPGQSLPDFPLDANSPVAERRRFFLKPTGNQGPSLRPARIGVNEQLRDPSKPVSNEKKNDVLGSLTGSES